MILSADAKATHQAVVTAMDVAGQLGFSKLSITTRRDEDAE
jgi:biopolymer transport protein ExbD